MPQPPFSRIGIIAKPTLIVNSTITLLIKLLTQFQRQFILESSTAAFFRLEGIETAPLENFHQHCDLTIVIGGDGTMLKAARALAAQNIPVLGINLGKLGFLTDILPQSLSDHLLPVLEGMYQEESRLLLCAEIHTEQGPVEGLALNDIVLTRGPGSHMINIEIAINGDFVCEQSGDGLIIATPTGSTAYALSGGGPIICPALDAITLVPMCPHTLSLRPLVVPSVDPITIKILPDCRQPGYITCDGLDPIILLPKYFFTITRAQHRVRLIHPLDYNYYDTLRSKLGWGEKPLPKGSAHVSPLAN